jgi:hypothetical protein
VDEQELFAAVKKRRRELERATAKRAAAQQAEDAARSSLREAMADYAHCQGLDTGAMGD